MDCSATGHNGSMGGYITGKRINIHVWQGPIGVSLEHASDDPCRSMPIHAGGCSLINREDSFLVRPVSGVDHNGRVIFAYPNIEIGSMMTADSSATAFS